jgi:hypothetical protein
MKINLTDNYLMSVDRVFRLSPHENVPRHISVDRLLTLHEANPETYPLSLEARAALEARLPNIEAIADVKRHHRIVLQRVRRTLAAALDTVNRMIGREDSELSEPTTKGKGL